MRAAVLVDGGQPGRAGVHRVRSWRRPRSELLNDCGPIHWRQPIRLAQIGDLHKASFLTFDVTVAPAALISHLLATLHQPTTGMSERFGTRQYLLSAVRLELRQWADDEYPAGAVGRACWPGRRFLRG